MRDWRHDAEQYRDLDRAAQERAEKELGRRLATPAPWESPGTDGEERVVSFRDGQGKRRTLAHVYGRTDAERDANARLIALAPRMAEALRALIVAVKAAHATDMRLLTLGVADDARAILRELDGGTR